MWFAVPVSGVVTHVLEGVVTRESVLKGVWLSSPGSKRKSTVVPVLCCIGKMLGARTRATGTCE